MPCGRSHTVRKAPGLSFPALLTWLYSAATDPGQRWRGRSDPRGRPRDYLFAEQRRGRLLELNRSLLFGKKQATACRTAVNADEVDQLFLWMNVRYLLLAHIQSHNQAFALQTLTLGTFGSPQRYCLPARTRHFTKTSDYAHPPSPWRNPCYQMESEPGALSLVNSSRRPAVSWQ